MDRRAFLLVVPWAMGSLAQRALAGAETSPRRVGVLFWGPQNLASLHFERHFVEALGRLGHRPGRDLQIEWRYADGDSRRDDRLARELVEAGARVIVTAGSERVGVVHRAAPGIPIVAYVDDPVARGYASSLARPGGSITGLTVEVERSAVKQLDLVRRLIPRLTHVAIIIDAATTTPESRAAPVVRAARQVGLTSEVRLVEGEAGFERVFVELRGREARAAYVLNWRTTTDSAAVAAMAVKHRVATMSIHRDLVEKGGLLASFVSPSEVGGRLAALVDKVLRGAKAAETPIESPMRFDLLLNRGTAKALGLQVPAEVLLEVDEVLG